MKTLWHGMQTFVRKSHLRLPIFLITILLLILLYAAPSMLVIKLLLASLAISLLFESIHPAGFWSTQPIIMALDLPRRIRSIIETSIRLLMFVVGIFLLILALYVIVSI